jgi:membrane associated rhomboid family serine protease
MNRQNPSAPAPDPVSQLTWIPVQSRRKAMDWSLVLISQGIESTIERSADESAEWGLRVNSNHYAQALQILRQYKIENRGFAWQHELRWPGMRFDFACLFWAVLLGAFYWLASSRAAFRAAGVMDTVAVASGQWWRVFTAMLLHADLAHLAANLSTGILLVGLAMGRYGRGVGLLAAFLAGGIGNVASLLLNPKPFVGLGASEMVMGALGLLVARARDPNAPNASRIKHLLGGVGAGVMLFLLFGLSQDADTAAHLGGFVGGALLGLGMARMPAKMLQRGDVNVAAGSVLAAFVALTWWLALR